MRVIPGYAFHGLVLGALVALCAAGFLPADQFTDLMKWLLIVCGATVVLVPLTAMVRRPAPEAEFGPFTTAEQQQYMQPPMGAGMPLSSGIFAASVFEDALGHDTPDHFTPFVRDPQAAPVTTDDATGVTVLVPADGAPASAFESEFSGDPPYPSPPVIILGNPSPKEIKQP